MGHAAWAIAGVGWCVTVVGWLLSPIISLLLNRFFSSPPYAISRKLRDLEIHTIPSLKLTLRDVEEQRMLRAASWDKRSESELVVAIDRLGEDLRSALYEAEDILDLVDYHRLESKVLMGAEAGAGTGRHGGRSGSSCKLGAAPAPPQPQGIAGALVLQCARRWYRQLPHFGGASRRGPGVLLPISDADSLGWSRHLVVDITNGFRSLCHWSTSVIVAARVYRDWWWYEAVGVKTNRVRYHLTQAASSLPGI